MVLHVVRKQNDVDRYHVVGSILNMMIRKGLSKEVTFELRPEKMRWSWLCREMG